MAKKKKTKIIKPRNQAFMVLANCKSQLMKKKKGKASYTRKGSSIKFEEPFLVLS